MECLSVGVLADAQEGGANAISSAKWLVSAQLAVMLVAIVGMPVAHGKIGWALLGMSCLSFVFVVWTLYTGGLFKDSNKKLVKIVRDLQDAELKCRQFIAMFHPPPFVVYEYLKGSALRVQEAQKALAWLYRYGISGPEDVLKSLSPMPLDVVAQEFSQRKGEAVQLLNERVLEFALACVVVRSQGYDANPDWKFYVPDTEPKQPPVDVEGRNEQPGD